MPITLQTSITQLLDSGKISARTYNCLKYSGYETIEDIVSNINKTEDLLNIRNFGRKSYEEMLKVFINVNNFVFGEKSLKEYGNFDGKLFSEAEMAYNTFIAENEYLKSSFPSVKELHSYILKNKSKIITFYPNLSKDDNITIRYCIKSYIENVLNGVSQEVEYKAVVEAYQTVLSEIENNINSFSVLDEYLYFNSAELNKYLQTIYEEYCVKKLSNRARNFQSKFLPRVENILPYFDADINDYYKIYPGSYARKTIQELFDFTQSFKLVYYKNTNKKADEIKTYSFPFLLSNQKKFLVDFEQQYGHLPYWYILYQYIKVSNNRSDQIFCWLYGIYDGKERTLEEIGHNIGLSSERVRQILKHNTGITQKNDIIEGINSNYNSLILLPFFTEDFDEYKYVSSTERINVEFKTFARLFALVTDFYVDEINGEIILINKKQLGKFSLARCVRTFENKMSARYSEDTIINIDDILADSSNENTENAKGLLSYVITKILRKNLSANGDIFIEQNYIDVSKEAYNILEQNGAPMTLDEILETFKKKYPEHKIDDVSDLRPYLLKNEHIKAIGRKSTYALTSWKNINFSSIRDLIIKKLSMSSNPVHINDILKYVSKHYRETNIKSISTTMQSDELERFVRFENGFYGLTSKQYSDSFCKAQTIPRTSFEERIKDYRNFIETFHRFPYSTDSEVEGSLTRWARNIIYNNIDISAEQRFIFDEMIKSYDNSGYPRNGLENEFLNNCNEYKAFVEKHHNLPTVTTNQFLYSWYYRSKANYNSYTDQRRQYLTDLFKFISSYGFGI